MSNIDRGPRDTHPEGWKFVGLVIIFSLALGTILLIVLVCWLGSFLFGTRKPGDDYDLRRALRNAGLA